MLIYTLSSYTATGSVYAYVLMLAYTSQPAQILFSGASSIQQAKSG